MPFSRLALRGLASQCRQFDGGYHYRGRADIFFQIGSAFGRAILPLLNKTPANHAPQVAQARARAKKKYGFAKTAGAQ